MLEEKVKELMSKHDELVGLNEIDKKEKENLKRKLKNNKECLKLKNKKLFYLMRMPLPIIIGVLILFNLVPPMTFFIASSVVLSIIIYDIVGNHYDSKCMDMFNKGCNLMTPKEELTKQIKEQKNRIKSLQNSIDNRNVSLDIVDEQIESLGVIIEFDKLYGEGNLNVREKQIEELKRIKEQYIYNDTEKVKQKKKGMVR